MPLELHLSEQEQNALIQLANAAGKDVEEYLHDMVRIELETGSDLVASSDIGSDQWRRQLRECIALHPRVGHVDDSRESIYGDR